MGSVVGLPPKPPPVPLRCGDPECRARTFFVYTDGHVRCSKCGLEQVSSPLDSLENELGEEIRFDPDPSLLNG